MFSSSSTDFHFRENDKLDLNLKRRSREVAWNYKQDLGFLFIFPFIKREQANVKVGLKKSDPIKSKLGSPMRVVASIASAGRQHMGSLGDGTSQAFFRVEQANLQNKSVPARHYRVQVSVEG